VRAATDSPAESEASPARDADLAEWDALALDAGNVFATPEFLSTWRRHFGAGWEPRQLACHDPGGRLIALVPLGVRGRRPLRLARFDGHGTGDELGAVCAREHRPAVAAALHRALGAGELDADLLVGERLTGGDWAGDLGVRPLRTESSPRLLTDATTWDDYLATKSSNLRGQLRTKERRLARKHRLEYRLADDPSRLGEDMEVLFGLHEQRWGPVGSVAFAGARADFHRDLARVMLERGWLRLWFLELDGQPVAAWHGFRYAGAEWFYQSGRDPSWERSSVGLVLLAHTIRAAIEDGIGDYRLLRGGEQYKDRFATDDPGLQTLTVPRGIAGRAATALARGAFAVPEPTRARLRRTARRLRR
jgi:CelD/BcsL family acetyltransferase involved in cellulose biosynthesis